MAESEGNMYVATVVRDDFFNDPFFKDWWADFDVPMAAFNRQTSGNIYNVILWSGLCLYICLLF